LVPRGAPTRCPSGCGRMWTDMDGYGYKLSVHGMFQAGRLEPVGKGGRPCQHGFDTLREASQPTLRGSPTAPIRSPLQSITEHFWHKRYNEEKKPTEHHCISRAVSSTPTPCACSDHTTTRLFVLRIHPWGGPRAQGPSWVRCAGRPPLQAARRRPMSNSHAGSRQRTRRVFPPPQTMAQCPCLIHARMEIHLPGPKRADRKFIPPQAKELTRKQAEKLSASARREAHS